MQATNCPRCGRLFAQIRANICPVCEKEEDELFLKVRKYIDDNPNCTISELSKETEVSQKRILQFIREGRLEISKGMIGEINCIKCGKPVTKGTLCDKCALTVAEEMRASFANSNKKSGMHTTRRV